MTTDTEKKKPQPKPVPVRLVDPRTAAGKAALRDGHKIDPQTGMVAVPK
jgi:hypothetical protein